MEWLKKPSFVRLYKNKNEILSGTVKFEVDHNGEPNAIIDLKKISVEQEQELLKAFSIKSVPFIIVFYSSNFNGLFLGESIQEALEDEQIDVLASFERLLDDITLLTLLRILFLGRIGSTVKLDFKDLLIKEQIDFKELFTDYQLFYTINLLMNKELLPI